MIPEDFPEEFQGGNPHFQKEAYLKDADRIICVSNYTMSRLAHHYPELVHKARVIPCGVADPAPYQSFQERNSSILYVGNRGGYKDFTSILRALPEVIKYEPTIQLLAVGDQKFTESEKSLISELGLTDKVFQKELTNGELYAAYQSCLLTVVSSHVEGFGLPVIEAMSYGALVVATDIPVFREISGEAFVSFQPGNSNDLAKKLTKILKSPEDFEKLREIGIQVAKNYSWQSTLIRLYKLYEEI
jgi:glycosyltransferase involved in cell wall biosynthesis